MHKFLLAFALSGAAGAAHAQNSPSPAAPPAGAAADSLFSIEPDRADFTLGTTITPRGHVQVENSSVVSQRGPIRQYQIAETLIRIPVRQNLELRATTPAYIVDRDIGFNGLDDGRLDARLRFGGGFDAGQTTEFALTFGTTLPTGNRLVAERRYQPRAIFSASRRLNERANLTANLGLARPTDLGERFTQSILALELDYDVRPNLNLFGEVYGFNRLSEGSGSQKFVAGGAVYRIGDKTALFGRGGVGISNDVDGTDRFFQAGFARLF